MVGGHFQLVVKQQSESDDSWSACPPAAGMEDVFILKVPKRLAAFFVSFLMQKLRRMSAPCKGKIDFTLSCE